MIYPIKQVCTPNAITAACIHHQTLKHRAVYNKNQFHCNLVIKFDLCKLAFGSLLFVFLLASSAPNNSASQGAFVLCQDVRPAPRVSLDFIFTLIYIYIDIFFSWSALIFAGLPAAYRTYEPCPGTSVVHVDSTRKRLARCMATDMKFSHPIRRLPAPIGWSRQKLSVSFKVGVPAKRTDRVG